MPFAFARQRARITALAALVVATAVVLLSAPAAHATVRKTATKTAATVTTSTPARLPVSQLKIMNYYPADDGWTLMWTNYSHTKTVSDFQAIASLGANTVRIIVQPQAVGYPTVTATGLTNFRDMLAVAQSTGLSVQLTFFDWWSSYTDVTGSESWLKSLLAGQAGNPSIALVELQNEMPTSTDAVSWAQTLMPFLSTVLPGVPRTISSSGTAGLPGITTLAADLPTSSLDVIDVHYYGDAAGVVNAITTAQGVAAGRPIIIGEAGVSTLDGAAGEEAQARFYRMIGKVTATDGLPPAAPWILSDFTSTASTSTNPAQYHYGLRRLDGTWKPAAAVVKQVFTGTLGADDADGGFEREVNNGGARLGSWTPYDTADGVGTVATDVVRSGAQSVCFTGTGGSSSAVPSVQQSFPVLAAGRTITVTGYVDRANPTGGERIGVAWFDVNGHYLGQKESTYANQAGVWQQLSVSAVAPAGATVAQVHLKTSNESGRACWDDVAVNY